MTFRRKSVQTEVELQRTPHTDRQKSLLSPNPRKRKEVRLTRAIEMAEVLRSYENASAFAENLARIQWQKECRRTSLQRFQQRVDFGEGHCSHKASNLCATTIDADVRNG